MVTSSSELPDDAASAASCTTSPCAAAAVRESTTATRSDAISAATHALRYMVVNSSAGVMTSTSFAGACSMAARYSTADGALDLTGSRRRSASYTRSTAAGASPTTSPSGRWMTTGTTPTTGGRAGRHALESMMRATVVIFWTDTPGTLII